METGFAFLDEVLPGIRWDAKYATWDNFTGTPVDGYEVNTLPGLTSYSRFPRMMAAAGMPPADVIDRLVSLTLTGKVQ